MLPLSIKDDEYKPPRLNLLRKVSGWFSLGLISDSFHMFFDCTALLAGLAASVISKWRSNDAFSYGYVRAEVLAGFVNGLFLIFTAFFIFSEGVEGMSTAILCSMVVSATGTVMEVTGTAMSRNMPMDTLMAMAMDTLMVRIIVMKFPKGRPYQNVPLERAFVYVNVSIIVFTDDHSLEVVGGSSKQILQGVFLHIVADTLGSIGVIISAILMQNYGLMIADPICSMLIALLIGVSIVPLLKESIGILMQRTPPSLENVLPQCYQRVGVRQLYIQIDVAAM
ncbi:solute carrier family 30 member 7 [Willisornis vidua]|uniref:Zinc transporter n=1 Tax=Willisornis vidua TaxID=1566151 RepID=A0ABQ9CZ00_9PASS|nr:solute carrier family 30 member 7 [Willisornis vidua]